MGNLLSTVCVPVLHWFRLFGWVPVLGWLIYRSPLRSAIGLIFYYFVLSRQPWWIRIVRKFAQLGHDKRFHLIKHCDIDTKNKRYLFAVHPHGLYCDGVLYSCIIDKQRFEEAYPGLHYAGAGADQVSYLPFFRELMATPDRGMIGVSKREILTAFKKDPTVSVGICPGGFAEAVFTHSENSVEYAYLKGRRGFIKLAIEAGVDIVPVYSFGLNKLYNTPRCLRGLRARIAQRFAVPMVIWGGRWWTNQPLPGSEVYTVVGAPFPASQYTIEEIDKAHADYCASLKSLYDEYKDRYNDGKPLVFIGKDFHDSDIIPTVFRRLGVHTSHVIPGTVQHRIELKQFAEEKRKEKVQRLQALEDERNEMINGEL